jgi:hypothetical protein
MVMKMWIMVFWVVKAHSLARVSNVLEECITSVSIAEVTYSSRTLVTTYKIMWHYNSQSEDDKLHKILVGKSNGNTPHGRYMVYLMMLSIAQVM